MPTYEYECLACKKRFERFQKFTDPAVTECPECAGQVRKVLFPAGIVFKGSGWYKTDSRPSVSSDNGSSSGAASETKTDSKTDTKTETKVENKSATKSEASGSAKSDGAASKSASSTPTTPAKA
jgi:putative FmdB family regulatory protein